MPTERFYHLPGGKRAAIRAAALREFTRAPLEQVSINRIVKEAGISRGSFYTYFEDKRDVMFYLLEDIKEKMELYCLKSFKASGGDLFFMMESAFTYMVEYLKEEDHLRLYRNMLLNSDLFERILTGKLEREKSRFGKSKLMENFYESASQQPERYREPVRARFELLMELAGHLMMKNAFECCYREKGIGEAKEEFHGKLELLKSLVYRESFEGFQQQKMKI